MNGSDSFGWIASELKDVEMSPERSFLTEKDMRNIVRNSYELDVEPKLIRKYRKMVRLE